MRLIKCLLGLSVVYATTTFANAVPLDSIAAIVNENIITKSELAQQVKLAEKQFKNSAPQSPDPLALEKQVLDHMILNEVQMQMAKRTGIQVEDTALDDAIENIASQNRMSVTELREALVRDGLDFKHYRENIRHQIMISQLQQRDVMSDVQVSEQEVSQFLQSPNGQGGMNTEYRLSHILVSLPDAPTPQQIDTASKKAASLVENLRKGKDFSAAALAESTGDSALHGGDLGYRKLPEMPTLFVKIVPTLKVNDIPDPIRSASGFHIIKLIDKRTTREQGATVQRTQVRHILITTNANNSDDDAQRKLAEIRKMIVKGEDFAQIAKAHSTDMATSSNGGSLGWVTNDMLVPEFAEQMDKLAVNDVSEPFKTSFGWHIVQVQDRKTQANDESGQRQKAREAIRQRKLEEKLQAWSRQLRDESYVKTYYDNATTTANS
jgi:peptidyl-prolyl cis-trans isomerase SurA